MTSRSGGWPRPVRYAASASSSSPRLSASFASALALELADALAREAQLGADRLERPWLVVEAEAKLEHASLSLGKLCERKPDRLPPQESLGEVAGVVRVFVR